jgi:hypothetical protein
MEGKQLPDDFADWIKARTFIIGEETALELDLQGDIEKGADSEKKSLRHSGEECLETRKTTKIVPAFRLKVSEFSLARLCHTE